MPIRIHMVFGETSILVPCGDGKLSVAELVEKGVRKFKKLIAKVLHFTLAHQLLFLFVHAHMHKWLLWLN